MAVRQKHPRRGARLFLLLAALSVNLAPAYVEPAQASSTSEKIVWEHGTGSSWEIWVMNPDGSGRTRLTSGHIDVGASWSPDGRKIAFARMTAADVFDVHVMNADGTGLTRLTAQDDRSEFDPTWAPDGQRIAYTRYLQSGGVGGQLTPEGIWTMNADGTSQTQLVSPLDGSEDGQAAWSPDGQKIAFVGWLRSFDTVVEIYTVDVSGGQITRLTDSSGVTAPSVGGFASPDWSPDGSKIAFGADSPVLSDGGPTSRIATINADGSGFTDLTRHSALETHDRPAWSPDGQKIAFVGSPEQGAASQPDIYLMSADGSGMTPITNDAAGDEAPDWAAVPLDTVHEGDLIVTDCDDPYLATVTEITGDLIFEGLDCDAPIALPNLVKVHGSIRFNSNVISVTADGHETIIIPEVHSVGGDLEVNGNTINITADGHETIIIPEVHSVGGDVSITDNGDAEIVVPALRSVGCHLTIATTGSLHLGALQFVGCDMTLTAHEADTVSAITANGTTDVSVLGGTASMRVVLPTGTFDQPVPFTITREPDRPAEDGSTPGGAPATVDPVGGYHFSFAIPELNRDAELAFTIDLSQLDPETRKALLDGVDDGSTTIVVKGDEDGDAYQALPRCQDGQSPKEHSCVAIVLLDANGNPVTDPDQAAYVRFSGVTGHFSTFAVALVTPHCTGPLGELALELDGLIRPHHPAAAEIVLDTLCGGR